MLPARCHLVPLGSYPDAASVGPGPASATSRRAGEAPGAEPPRARVQAPDMAVAQKTKRYQNGTLASGSMDTPPF